MGAIQDGWSLTNYCGLLDNILKLNFLSAGLALIAVASTGLGNNILSNYNVSPNHTASYHKSYRAFHTLILVDVMKTNSYCVKEIIKMSVSN